MGGGGGLETASEADGALFFLWASEAMSGFSMSMYACMSEMAESDAPAGKADSMFEGGIYERGTAVLTPPPPASF